MKLYVIPGAPNCRKAQAVALHLGIGLETVALDVRRGDAGLPEHLALNPNGYTPTLVDGDLVLWESAAVMQYLCEQRPANTLFPADPARRADIARWQFWEAANLQRIVRTFFTENVVKPRYLGQQPEAARMAGLVEPFHRCAAILDRHLRGREFVAGGQLTLADFSLAGAFCYAGPAQLPWESYGEIRRWYAGIDRLPAWQATAPARARPETRP